MACRAGFEGIVFVRTYSTFSTMYGEVRCVCFPSYNNPVNQRTYQPPKKSPTANLFIGKQKDLLVYLGDAVLDMVVLISVRFIYAGTVVFDSLKGQRYC